MTDQGRLRHYGEFYCQPTDGSLETRGCDRPLWLVVGNCQAEALRTALAMVPDRPFSLIPIPPVHELGPSDVPYLDALLRRTAVLLSQPIRNDYRDLPLGTAQLAASLPAGASVIQWPVIRYAGLYPFQVIVRRPADRSVVPPAVPYHDLRTIAAALHGRSAADPWDVDVEPGRLRAVAEVSKAALAEREARDTDVGVSDVLASAGRDAAHAINHPGNTVLAILAERVLHQMGIEEHVELPGEPLLGSVYAPLEQRVLAAQSLAGPPRTHWQFQGSVLDAGWVHRTQLRWYEDNPDFLELALERHGHIMDLLGLLPSRTLR